MAFSMATVASQAMGHCACPTSLSSNFGGSSSQLRSQSVVAAMAIRPRGLVCRADSNNFTEARKAVDAATKVSISEKDVLQNQETNASEKKSVFGAEPAPGALPRPEVARRPETGNTSIGSIMAFDGPGPETMNGRLAMLGCAWAFVVESTTGQRIIDQINYPGSPGLFWLLASIQILVIATLVPFFNGESPDSRKFGPFTAKAERWNGRLAMIGFAGILAYEFANNAPVVHF